jgi:GTP cyclohydrolase I
MSISHLNSMSKHEDPLEALFSEVISQIGEDVQREGLLDTPKRISKMYREIFSGLHIDPASVLGKTFPSEGMKDIIIVQDINFYSVCEHHFAPFFGKVHIGYVPEERIVGLSKFARLVDVLSKRPQVQEKLTQQILTTLVDVIAPKGVMVIVEAEHLCMSMRGIKKPGSKTRTVSRQGLFDVDQKYEDRFFRLLHE